MDLKNALKIQCGSLFGKFEDDGDDDDNYHKISTIELVVILFNTRTN